MAKRSKRLTIILVPETGSRTLTLHIARSWFTVAAFTVIGLITAIGALSYLNRDLKSDLVDLEQLKKANLLQQAQLEEMAAKAKDTQHRIETLNQLEQQIREMTGQNSSLPSRGAESFAAANPTLGRGGPQAPQAGYEELPTLGMMLPPDARAHLFAKRDTLDVHLLDPSANQRKLDDGIAYAAEVQSQMDAQIEQLDTLIADLSEGKEKISEMQDYLAHRPTGMPISGAMITDRFGYRWSPFGWGRQFHNGIDLAQDYWTPIVATGDGIVTHAGWMSGGYGYAVEISHGYGLTTLYGHMVDWDVTVGQAVKRGERIGWVGSSGDSTGPHVHYEVHLDGVPTDPARYFN